MRYQSREDELKRFKADINLCEFAASHGFVLDTRKSGRARAVMNHANGDKLIVSKGRNDHWVYLNAFDDRDKGTIVDFVLYRERCSLGEVRKILRGWSGASGIVSDLGIPSKMPNLKTPEHDALSVLARWDKATLTEGRHHYLEVERQIPVAVLSDARFKDVIRKDARGNALFGHWKDEELCGIEIKNRGFTGFAPGGIKGLWRTAPQPDDRELWICETAIDGLSVAALFGTSGRSIVSTAGHISSLQNELLVKAALSLPEGSRVILATDNDAAGIKLSQTIRERLEAANVTAPIHECLPPEEGLDWNDVLRREGPRSIPCPRFV